MPDDRNHRDDTAAPDDTAARGNTAASGETGAESRRRLDEIFGEVLPETTSDERDETPSGNDGRDGRPGGNDEWLRANRPPHH